MTKLLSKRLARSGIYSICILRSTKAISLQKRSNGSEYMRIFKSMYKESEYEQQAKSNLGQKRSIPVCLTVKDLLWIMQNMYPNKLDFLSNDGNQAHSGSHDPEFQTESPEAVFVNLEAFPGTQNAKAFRTIHFDWRYFKGDQRVLCSQINYSRKTWSTRKRYMPSCGLITLQRQAKLTRLVKHRLDEQQSCIARLKALLVPQSNTPVNRFEDDFNDLTTKADDEIVPTPLLLSQRCFLFQCKCRYQSPSLYLNLQFCCNSIRYVA